MARRMDFSQYPKLRLDASNVQGSWSSWLVQFEISVEMMTLELGKDQEGEDKFRGRPKFLALLSALGNDGIDTLKSLGFDLKSAEDDAYEKALDLLKAHYERGESKYVRIMKLVTVSQACGESDTDYLLRVEKLSRNVAFGSDELREDFAVGIAVNGLYDPSFRRLLLQETELTWKDLNARTRARCLAKESDSLISEARSGQYNMKKEIKREVSKVSRPSSSDSSAEEQSVNRVSRSYRSRYSRDSQRRSNRFKSPSYRSDSSRERYGRSGRTSRRAPSRGDWRDRDSSRDSHSSRGSRDSSRDSRYSRDSRSRDEVCYVCQKSGHRVRKCPEAICFSCKEKGHTAMDCKRRRSSRRSPDAHRSDSDREWRERSRRTRLRSRSPTRSVKFAADD